MVVKEALRMKDFVVNAKMNDRKHSFAIAGTEIVAPPLEPALHVVSTPIGNLSDITLRALQTLAAADLIACEDTRVTRILLNRYAIRTPMTAVHEHNEAAVAPRLVAEIMAGKAVALVSDAGTPLLSDPGFRLVREAVAAGVRIVPVPGASALLSALVAAGLPGEGFFFAGFTPQKAGARAQRLAELAPVPGALVFYESPRRLSESLAAMAEAFGGSRQATVARELTKTFEELRSGTLATLCDHYRQAGSPKGEVVVVVGPPPAPMRDAVEVDDLLLGLAATLPAAKAAAEAARQTGLAKAALYRRLLTLKEGGA